MSLASSSPKHTLDRPCINIVKAEDQPCNVTDDTNNQGPDCYESMHAFKKIRTSTSGLRKSPNKWTKEENQKLASLVASYGEKKWKRISAEMGGQKTGAQCAQHWKRVLSPEIRKGHWDENEEDLLLRLVVQYGSCWKKIAKKIPQRTDIQCRYQYLKAKQSREVLWDNKEDESLMKKVMEMANCNFFQASDSTSTAHPAAGNHTTTTTTSMSSILSPISSSSSGSEGSPSPNLSSSPSSMSESASMTDSPMVGRFIPSPLRPAGSPMLSSPTVGRSVRSPGVRIKENDDSESSGSSGSEGGRDEMKSSGETWNDDKHNVNMSDTPEPARDSTTSSWRSSGSNSKDPASLSESLCANCRSPFITHVNKVVWLEISEHMARLKLTSTLRTALECKTRFMELLGNKISFPIPNLFANTDGIKAGLKTSGDIGKSEFNLRGSGGIGNSLDGKGFPSSLSDTSNIKINNNKVTSPSTSGYNGNNINLTNCNNNNITINITNSYTTNNTLQNGINFQQLTHCSNNNSNTTSTPSTSIMKTSSELASASQLLPKAPILSPAPPFPSFSHLPPSFPHLPPPTNQLKPINNNHNHNNNYNQFNRGSVPNGLESLAAVASILPREMLADYF